MIVLVEGRKIAVSQLRKAERLLYRECELLNRGRYEDWLDLFTEDCRYWAPLSPGQDEAQSHSSLFHEDRTLMRMRIARLAHESAHSLAEGIRSSRTVGPAALREIDQSTGDWIVERRFQMNERQGDRVRMFAGLFTYRLRATEEGFRIREKRVDLIDCDAPHEPLEVFL